MRDKFTLSGGQSAKLEIAIERNKGETTDVEWLCAGDNFGSVIQLARGLAELIIKIKSVLHSLGKVVTVSATKTKNTVSCFTNETRYYSRDGDLDQYLPKNQPAQPESKFAVCELTQAATFKEMAEQILGIQGDTKTLAKLLKDRGYTTTLPAIEALIERQENGEDTGLLTNGYANFFFVENEDRESVSVVDVDRVGRRWGVFRSSLGGVYGWGIGSLLFVRNFPGTL